MTRTVLTIPEATLSAFATAFAPWHITLPASLQEASPFTVENDAGWFIRVRVDRNSESLLTEVYAAHRMTNSRHYFIHEDGSIQALEAPREFVVFGPADTEAERDAKREEYHEWTRRVGAELRARGLIP